MKKLFIYYSLTGNGDVVASCFNSNGYELRKVVEKKKMPKAFFFRVLFGGFRAGLNLKGRLVEFNSDISPYDEVVIGSPIWNGRFPPAINKVIDVTNLSGKKVTFVLYSGSGEGKKADRKIVKLFKDARIVHLKEPKSNQDELDKLNTFFGE